MGDWLGYFNGNVYEYTKDNAYDFIMESMRNADPSQLEVEKDKVTYYNIPASFDIEVSSFKAYDDRGNEIKCATMYIWQQEDWPHII